MNSLTASAFDLPDHLAAKADPALTAGDEQHFAAIAESLEQSIADLSDRLDAERKAPGGIGQEAMDRDMEIHRLTARLRALRRFGLDLCLGHMVSADNPEPVYVGRLGLTDSAGRRLLLDWRSPAAEPFFGATHANPMGLASRRRYRWTRGRISDYWDEVFTADGLEGHAALDDQSAFIASLGGSRSARMRDVLGTIQADQDAIIRAGSRGALVVDGGPGTGKTVVALHRSAYLLYADPRVGHRRGGVLFVGPHQPYLAYVADVLPNLGEEGVQTCTLRDLVAEGATAAIEADPDVARLKSSADLVKAIEAAVRFYEKPPATGMTVETPWSDIWLSAADWAEAYEAPEPGTPHNEARDQIWEELLTILTDKHDSDVPAHLLRRSLQQNRELITALNRAWPLLWAADLVGDLWSVPAYLRLCAPWLNPDDVQQLQREDAQAWTVSDLPVGQREAVFERRPERRDSEDVRLLVLGGDLPLRVRSFGGREPCRLPVGTDLAPLCTSPLVQSGNDDGVADDHDVRWGDGERYLPPGHPGVVREKGPLHVQSGDGVPGVRRREASRVRPARQRAQVARERPPPVRERYEGDEPTLRRLKVEAVEPDDDPADESRGAGDRRHLPEPRVRSPHSPVERVDKASAEPLGHREDAGRRAREALLRDAHRPVGKREHPGAIDEEAGAAVRVDAVRLRVARRVGEDARSADTVEGEVVRSAQTLLVKRPRLGCAPLSKAHVGPRAAGARASRVA